MYSSATKQDVQRSERVLGSIQELCAEHELSFDEAWKTLLITTLIELNYSLADITAECVDIKEALQALYSKN